MKRFLLGFGFVKLAIADYRRLMECKSRYPQVAQIWKGYFYNALNGKL